MGQDDDDSIHFFSHFLLGMGDTCVPVPDRIRRNVMDGLHCTIL